MIDIATKDITADTLLELARRGVPWFKELRDHWKATTGYDPVAVEAEVASAERRRDKWNNVPFTIGMSSLVAALVFIIATGVYYKITGIQPTTLILFWTLGSAVSITAICTLIQHVAKRRLPRGKDLYPAAAQGFCDCLTDFLIWVDKTPADLDGCHKEDLFGLAEAYLTDRAFEVVVLQRMDPEKYPDDWGVQIQTLRQQLKVAREKLDSLDLVYSVLTPYYHEAERRYRMKQQSQS